MECDFDSNESNAQTVHNLQDMSDSLSDVSIYQDDNTLESPNTQANPSKMQKHQTKPLARGNIKLGNAIGYLSAQNLAQLDRHLSERDRKRREQKRQIKNKKKQMQIIQS